jgi:hypothetical protein
VALDLYAINKVRARVNAGLADARRALASTDGDVDAAVAQLREEGIAALVASTGAAREICARFFDETQGDLEHAVTRIRFSTGPKPVSPAQAIIDSDVDDEEAARDLHAMIGGVGDGDASDAIFRTIDFRVRLEADGLFEFLASEPSIEWEDVAAALTEIGDHEARALFDQARQRYPDRSLLAEIETRLLSHDGLAHRVMAYARAHRSELD